MPLKEFRKLQVDLPREEPVDSKPWQAAGIAFAIVIIGLIMFLYSNQKKTTGRLVKQAAEELRKQ